MYYVVVCPDKYCRGVSILEKKHKRPSCRKCNKSFKFEKFKVSFETENHSDAIAARTQLLTKQSDDDLSFDDIKDMGGLDEQEPAFTNTHEVDTRKPKQIVIDIIEDIDSPTRKNIINESYNTNLSEDKVKYIIDKLVNNGYVIKNNGEFELI